MTTQSASQWAAFASARLDEEEAAAKAAIAETAHLERARTGEAVETGEWRVNPNHEGAVIDDSGNRGALIIYSPKTPVINKHIALNDPGRTLRRIKAARRLIAEITSRSTEGVAEIYLMTIASAWNGHPDYPEEN